MANLSNVKSHLRRIEYRIPLNPIAWSRAGYNSKTRKFYDGQLDSKAAVGLYLQKYHQDQPLFDRAVQVEVVFSMRKQKGRKMIIHDKLPDIDNLIKFLFDAMQDVVLTNDKIVTKLVAEKKYSRDPMTKIIVTELDFNDEKKS